jgi:23S rRNA (cytosine1962-C5)-methyltransferase
VEILPLLDRALGARAALVGRLRAEGTDAFRVFHGAAEGREGLAVDLYGTLLLAQSFRGPLEAGEREAIEGRLRPSFPAITEVAFVERGGGSSSAEHVCTEAGVRFAVRVRQGGQDPGLFLDLRAGRRALRELAAGKTVLNLFAYTSAAGVAAAMAGASEVWNVDFSRSALEAGRRNAELNDLAPERLRFVQEDCLPVLRQLAGLPVKGRGSFRSYARFEPRTFDVVFLDPPAWSTGPFGAVDVERDYPALFKPAWLATAPGGTLIATNHAASVDLEAWREVLLACARKTGRPIAQLDFLQPDDDFPSRDGRPPLKIAVCRVPSPE